MESGTRVSYRISTVTHAPAAPNGVSLYGSKATLHWQPGDRMTLAPIGGEPQTLEPDPGTAGDWRVEQDFIDSIDLIPYNVSVVELAEGPRLVTNVESIAPDDVRIGMPVRIAPRKESNGQYAVVFERDE